MCMHWLKYIRLNRKDLSKNMRGTTVEVDRQADVSGAYSAISNVYQCVAAVGPSDMSLRHSLWVYLTLIGQQKVNVAALGS